MGTNVSLAAYWLKQTLGILVRLKNTYKKALCVLKTAAFV
jgi:hypothetical protein